MEPNDEYSLPKPNNAGNLRRSSSMHSIDKSGLLPDQNGFYTFSFLTSNRPKTAAVRKYSYFGS